VPRGRGPAPAARNAFRLLSPRRMDGIDVGDAASLVRELRATGLAESTIQGVLVAAGRTFKFAPRHMGSSAETPIALLENGERPRLADTPRGEVPGFGSERKTSGIRGSGVSACAWRIWAPLASIVSRS
jgi:hypothetical protein